MIMLWFFVQNCATDVATLFRQTWVSLRLFVFLSVCPSVRSYCGSENLMLCLPALSVRPSLCPQLLWLLAQAEALPVSTALQYKSRSRDRRSTRSKRRRGRRWMISLGDPARERELELVVFQINIFGFFSVCRLLYNESLVQCFSFSFFSLSFLSVILSQLIVVSICGMELSLSRPLAPLLLSISIVIDIIVRRIFYF